MLQRPLRHSLFHRIKKNVAKRSIRIRFVYDIYEEDEKKKREISITNESKIHSLKSNYRTDFTILFLHPRGGDYELHGCRVSKGPTSVQKWRE